MKKQKNMTKVILYLFLSILLAFFMISSPGELKANSISIQDTTDHGKMSHMNMDKGSKSGMKSDMQKMHKNMMGMKMTGDPDYDFASMMIKHHQGAIEMSKKEVNKGKDQEVKSLAKNIITDQNKEIKELQAFTKKNKPSKSNMNKDMTGSSEKNMSDKSMMDKMNDMQKEMQDMKMTGDQDKDYVSMMIMHHQHGIDMAKDYMDKAKDDNLKKMAQKMVDENKKQVDKMKDWQSNHK